MTNTSPLKFFWNGIKANGGHLQRCFYSEGKLLNHPEGTLTIYAKEGRFSQEVRDTFTVENNSDSMTDYFERDHIRVLPDHPLHAQVKYALDAMKAHNDKRWAKSQRKAA